MQGYFLVMKRILNLGEKVLESWLTKGLIQIYFSLSLSLVSKR